MCSNWWSLRSLIFGSSLYAESALQTLQCLHVESCLFRVEDPSNTLHRRSCIQDHRLLFVGRRVLHWKFWNLQFGRNRRGWEPSTTIGLKGTGNVRVISSIIDQAEELLLRETEFSLLKQFEDQISFLCHSRMRSDFYGRLSFKPRPKLEIRIR